MVRLAVVMFFAVTAGLGAGCGSEIGDSCNVSADCSQSDQNRFCDLNSVNGYCTIRGCNFGTCPGESECVRFFTGSFSNKACTPATEDCQLASGANACPDNATPSNDCNPDELCALNGHCVTRASEVRYCMRTCGSGGDCRDGYECRNADLMKMNGGEPVPPEGERLGDEPQAFCAQARAQQ
jgi:hypothetical protein